MCVGVSMHVCEWVGVCVHVCMSVRVHVSG